MIEFNGIDIHTPGEGHTKGGKWKPTHISMCRFNSNVKDKWCSVVHSIIHSITEIRIRFNKFMLNVNLDIFPFLPSYFCNGSDIVHYNIFFSSNVIYFLGLIILLIGLSLHNSYLITWLRSRSVSDLTRTHCCYVQWIKSAN